jgi:hypothetical protein
MQGCDPFDRNPVSGGQAEPAIWKQWGLVSEEGDLVSTIKSPSSLTTEGSYRCDDFIINPYP